jgi:ribonuclease HI
MLTEVFVDGGSRGQGQQKKLGEAACAVVIYQNRKHVGQYARPLGRRTNNEAEYEAVIAALLMCSMSGIEDPIIYSDSAVVCNHVSGKWTCTNANLLPLLMSIRIVQEDYRFRLVQVDRSFVYKADELVNECIDRVEVERKAANTIRSKRA